VIKSPIELVVGTLKQFDFKPAEALPFAMAAAGMGQNLFSPPNVKGWPGQETWINSSTLLARKQFLDRVFRTDDAGTKVIVTTMDAQAMAPVPKQALTPAGAQDPDKMRQVLFRRAMDRGLNSVQFDSATWFAQFGVLPGAAQRTDAATRLLLATAPQATPDPKSDPLVMVRGIVLDVSYQLK
jgi:hypothetical protein